VVKYTCAVTTRFKRPIPLHRRKV